MMKRLVWVGVIAMGLLHSGYASTAQAESTATSDGDFYAAGSKAMNEQRWADAIGAFDRVIAVRTGKHVDGALYWKAYCLSKLEKMPDAAASCAQLQSQFPSSSWNDDCKTLLVKDGSSLGDGASGSPGASSGSDADLKMLALNSLMNQDPARAIPIVRGMLAGNQPKEMKQHAIFVLTQSRSLEAAGLLHDAIVGKMGSATQRLAIPQIGVFEGKRMNDTLVEVFHSSTEPEVKRAVLSALFISNDAPRLVELARAEKNPEMKREIVSQLALMQDKAAADYMLELLK